MKKIIFSLATLLTLGLTSCVGDFEDVPVTYPAEGIPETGVWQNAYLDGDYDYAAVRTKSAAGDDLFYVVRTGKATGKDSGSVKMLMVSDLGTSYDEAIGMYSAKSAVTFYGDGENSTDSLQGTAYLAYQNNLEDYTLQLATSDDARQFTCTAQKTDNVAALPAPSGYWEGTAADGKYILLLLDPEESIGIIGSEDADAEYLDVETKNGVTTIKGLDSGEEVTLAYNEQYQVVATYKGATMVLDPQRASDSQPEMFFAWKTGEYNCSFFTGSDGGNYVYDGILFQSEKNANKYIIWPFIDNEDGMVVEMEDGALVVSPTPTGYVHPSYGMIWACDAVDYGIGSTPSSFDGKVFSLNLAYYVSAGYFGEFNDSFRITGDYEAEEGAPRRIAVNTSGARAKVCNPALNSKNNFLQYTTTVKQ